MQIIIILHVHPEMQNYSTKLFTRRITKYTGAL